MKWWRGGLEQTVSLLDILRDGRDVFSLRGLPAGEYWIFFVVMFLVFGFRFRN